MDGTAVLQIAAQTDGQMIQTAQFPVNGQQIRQSLGGMEVTAVTGVDHRDGCGSGSDLGRTLLGMAHGNDVSVVADGLCGIGHAFTLGSGGGIGLAETQHGAAQQEAIQNGLTEDEAEDDHHAEVGCGDAPIDDTGEDQDERADEQRCLADLTDGTGNEADEGE